MLGRLQRRRAAAGAQAIARERKVNLMRKYRTGELPDVQQLSIAAFLAPLGKFNSEAYVQEWWGGVGWILVGLHLQCQDPGSL